MPQCRAAQLQPGCADVVQPIAKLAESLAELIGSKRRLKDIAIVGVSP